MGPHGDAKKQSTTLSWLHTQQYTDPLTVCLSINISDICILLNKTTYWSQTVEFRVCVFDMYLHILININHTSRHAFHSFIHINWCNCLHFEMLMNRLTAFFGSLLQTPVLNSTAPRMNGVERTTASMAVCVTRTRPDQILLVKVISLRKLGFISNYLTFFSFWCFILSQISQRRVKAALAPSLCLAVSSLRLVFQLTSYTSMIPDAKERSGMAEWNSTLITRNTSVAQILW